MAKKKNIMVFELPFDVNSRTLADIRGSVFNVIEDDFSVGFNFNKVRKVSPSSGVGFFFKVLEEIKLRGNKLFFQVNAENIKIKNEDSIIKSIDKILEIQSKKESQTREEERIFELAGEINSAAVAGIREDCEKLIHNGTRVVFNMDRVSSVSPTSGMGFFLNFVERANKAGLPAGFIKNGNTVKITSEEEFVTYADKLNGEKGDSEVFTQGNLEVEVDEIDAEVEEIIAEDEEIVAGDEELNVQDDTSLHFDEAKAESDSYVIEEKLDEIGEIIAEEKEETEDDEQIIEIDGQTLNEVLEGGSDEDDVEIIKEDALLEVEEPSPVSDEAEYEDIIIEEEVIESSSDIELKDDSKALETSESEKLQEQQVQKKGEHEEVIFGDVKVSGIIDDEGDEVHLDDTHKEEKPSSSLHSSDEEVTLSPRLFSPMPETNGQENDAQPDYTLEQPDVLISDEDMDSLIESHEPELEVEIDEDELDFSFDDDIIVDSDETLDHGNMGDVLAEKKHFPVVDYDKESDLEDVSIIEDRTYTQILEEPVVEEKAVERLASVQDDDVIEIDEGYNLEKEGDAQDESVFLFDEEEAKHEQEYYTDRDERLEIEETFYDIEDEEDLGKGIEESTVEIDESISHIVEDFAHEHMETAKDAVVEVDEELYFDISDDIKDEDDSHIMHAQEIKEESLEEERLKDKVKEPELKNVFSDIIELPKTLTKFMDETPVKLSFLDGVQFEEEGVFDILTLIRFIHEKKPLGLMKESDYNRIMIDEKLKQFFKTSLGIKYYIETSDRKQFDIVAKRKSTGIEEVKIKFTWEDNKADISKTLTRSEEYISDFDTYFINIIGVNPASKTPVKTFLSEHQGIQFIKKKVGNYTFLISLHRYHNRGFYRIYHFFVNPVLK